MTKVNQTAERLRQEALARFDDDPKGALASFQEALKFEPRHIENWNQTGVLLYRLGQPKAATRAFEEVALLARQTGSAEWAGIAERNISRANDPLALADDRQLASLRRDDRAASAETGADIQLAGPAAASGALAHIAPPNTWRGIEPPDPKELLQAVNESAHAVRNGWVFFVAMMAFFFVAVAGVTHKDLLLDSPVPLPIVQVKIELTRFFQFAPLILVLLLFGVLLQYAMLASKTRTLHTLLEKEEDRYGAPRSHPLRLQLSSYFFVQAMAGPARSPLMGGFLRAMSWLTLGLLPLVLLLYFQTTFLPYHDPAITWAHRAYLAADFLVLLSIGIFTRFPDHGFWYGMWSNLRFHSLNVFLTLALWLSALFYCFGIATIPDSKLDRAVLSFSDRMNLSVCVPYDSAACSGKTNAASGKDCKGQADGCRRAFLLTAWLFEGSADKRSGKASSWFSRNLIVTDTDLVPFVDAKLEQANEVSLQLRNRDLRYARFDRSDMHRADLTGADLTQARLTGTKLAKARLALATLSGADLRKADLQGAVLREARLQRADMRKAKLQGIDLFLADMRDADLSGAQLQGADLREAKLQRINLLFAALQGADLRGAELREANLRDSELQGANLRGAQLQEADLIIANLRGAHLRGAQLQGADMLIAGLRGADLRGAQLQGADLSKARLQGADLRGAQLQGADLSGARLQGADMRGANLQGAGLIGARLKRTDLRKTNLQGADLTKARLQWTDLRGARIWQTVPPERDGLKSANLSGISVTSAGPDDRQQSVDALIAKIHDEYKKDRARDRLAPLFDNVKSRAWAGSSGHDFWTGRILSSTPANDPDFRAGLADQLADLACGDRTQQAWLAQGIVRRAAAKFNGDPARLYERLTGKGCLSGKRISADLLAYLKTAASQYKRRMARQAAKAAESKPRNPRSPPEAPIAAK